MAKWSLHPCLQAWSWISILVYEHGSGVSILVYEHGSRISILVYEHGERVRDLHPCLRAWVTEISILVYEHGSEISILVHLFSSLSRKLIPQNQYFWKDLFILLRRYSFTQCSPKKASYQESHESNRQIHRSRDDFIGIWTALDPFVEEIIDAYLRSREICFLIGLPSIEKSCGVYL